jgi:NADH dehydrogenase [ubiquinone] 1 alpha subcomplex assembly factor 5
MSRLISQKIKNILFQAKGFYSSKVTSTPSSLNVFDRETKRIQRIRTAVDPNYKDYEYVKAEVGYRVADRVFDIKRSFNTVLDLGCQRGTHK